MRGKNSTYIWITFFLFAISSEAATISKSYSFTSGQAASASAVNDNFDQLFTEINAKETRLSSLEAGAWGKNGTSLYYSSGNVGIGTSSPAAAFNILANATALDMTLGSWVSDARYNAIYLNGLYATSGAYNFLTSNFDQNLYINRPSGRNIQFRENNVDQVIVQNTTGNLGVGSTNPGFKLQVGESGDGTVARANSWTVFSDRRLKNILGPIEGAGTLVDRLNGYYFTWKEGKDSRRQVGVVAQEVEAVLPELVQSDRYGIKSVDYSKLSAVLIEAVKELRKRNEAMAEENSALKARVEVIERKLGGLRVSR